MAGARNPSTLLPQLALFGAAVLWGASFLATKVGMADVGPFGFVALRFIAATVVLAAMFPKAVRSITLPEVVAGSVVALFATTGYATQSLALQDVSSARVAFLSALYVPLVPALQFLLFREATKMGIWLGVAFSAVGVAVMSGLSATTFTLSAADLLSLASAVAIALEVVILGRIVAKADPLRIAIVTVGVTALLAGGLGVAMGEPLPRATTSLVWIVVAFGAATAYIQLAMSWGQRHVDTSRAAMIYSLEPVFGGLIGFAAGEALQLSEVTGGAIIIAGIVVASLPPLGFARWTRWRSSEVSASPLHAQEASP